MSNFRDWLTARYGDDEALKAAWRDPTVTLATAEIPFHSETVEPATVEEVILLINGPGDVRPDFYDWYNFRLDEKIAETEHFAELFSNLNPDRVILSDPANVPLSKFTTMQGATMDGETLYRSPYIDAVVHHPRMGHTDQTDSFNSQRINRYMTDQYAIHNGVIALWANEETSEVIDPDGDQENIWRLNSIAALHASMARAVVGLQVLRPIPCYQPGPIANRLRWDVWLVYTARRTASACNSRNWIWSKADS